jgi:hypothetical protein
MVKRESICRIITRPSSSAAATTAWLFDTIMQDLGNNIVKGGMHNLFLALARQPQRPYPEKSGPIA